jgi:hypothetical protein
MIHLEARSKNYDFSKEELRKGVVDNTCYVDCQAMIKNPLFVFSNN